VHGGSEGGGAHHEGAGSPLACTAAADARGKRHERCLVPPHPPRSGGTPPALSPAVDRSQVGGCARSWYVRNGASSRRMTLPIRTSSPPRGGQSRTRAAALISPRTWASKHPDIYKGQLTTCDTSATEMCAARASYAAVERGNLSATHKSWGQGAYAQQAAQNYPQSRPTDPDKARWERCPNPAHESGSSTCILLGEKMGQLIPRGTGADHSG